MTDSDNGVESDNNNESNMDELMRTVLQSVKTIAVVGASDKPHRAAFGVMQFLQARGYRCIPVNPRLAGKQLSGEEVYANLAEIPEPVDMADLFVNSELAGLQSDAALAAGIKVIWMQLGVINEAAAQRAREAGATVIMDHCPAQEWRRLGLPDSIAES